MDEAWSLYIIQTQAGKLYTGITKDLQRRFEEHQKSSRGARFFHFSDAEKIVYSEQHPDRSAASKREREIKKMNRKEKLELVKMQKHTHAEQPQALIVLPVEDEALLAECRIDTYRSSGPGGQNVNVTNSAVRLTHLATGLVVTSQKERSHHCNLEDCLKKLRALVEKRNYRKPKRVPTRKSASVKRQESLHKAKDSQKKRLRGNLFRDLE